MGKFFYATGDWTKHLSAIGKCAVKYAKTWPKLARTKGTPCTLSRFVDNSDGTVTNNATGLQWEKETSVCPSIRCVDETYTWSATSTAGDGTAFTSFLHSLNSSPCFAGHCDWRLPTAAELQTIVLEPYPCASSPCIDPIFDPSQESSYWSSTTYALTTGSVWLVSFALGDLNYDLKISQGFVRAVRGGL